MQEHKTPHETSWLFIIIFMILATIFGWFIVYTSRGVELMYAETATIEQVRYDSSIQKFDLADSSSLHVPSLDVYGLNQSWMYVSEAAPLPKTYEPAELVDVTLPRADKEVPMKLRADVLKRLEQLFSVAKQDGNELMVSSAYRSISDQQELYDDFVRTRSEAVAKQYVLTPGTSEHHTGYAVDITDASVRCEQDSSECNLSPASATWLATNSPKYGFIVRYPSGKEPITGIAHEPWHFRYVGVVLAMQLTEADLALDEFIEQATPGRIR